MKYKIVFFICGIFLGLSGCKKNYTATYQFTETPELLPEYECRETIEGQKIQYCKFGDFPQTIKAKNVKVSALPEANGYYVGSDANYYAKIIENGCSLDTYYSDGTIVKPQSNPGNILYFKVEPVIWQVISVNYGDGDTTQKSFLLLSDKILYSGIPYYDDSKNERIINGKTVYPSNYIYSTMRAYLNGTSYPSLQSNETKWQNNGFLQTAFTESSRKKICLTKIDNSPLQMSPDGKNRINEDMSFEDCKDKVFLLSQLEVVKEGDLIFPSYDKIGKKSLRIKLATDYALANYCSRQGKDENSCNWWLRSPYYQWKDRSRTVLATGYARYTSQVDCLYEGIVPAITVNEIK